MVQRKLQPLWAVLLLISGILATIEQPATGEKPAALQSPPVKKQISATYGGGSSYGGGGSYGYGNADESGEYEVAYGHSHKLVDDYICDLDASILVVTNSEKAYKKESGDGYGGGGGDGYGEKQAESGYEKPAGYGRAKRGAGYGKAESGEYGGGDEGGYGQQQKPSYGGYEEQKPSYAEKPSYGEQKPSYGEQKPSYGEQKPSYGEQKGQDYGSSSYVVAKAHRLRCSAIAVNSDEDCKKCCNMAARKERSISKDSIVGFIVDYDEIRQPGNNYQASGPYRLKRDAAAVYAPSAKPEDYQYGGMKSGGGGEYGGKQEQSKQNTGYEQQQPSQGYGGANGGQSYGEQPQKSDYGSSPSYSYNYPQRPKNPRCVCCAPKSHAQEEGGNYGSGYGKPKSYGGAGGYEKQRPKNNYSGGNGYEPEEGGEQYGGGGGEYQQMRGYGGGDDGYGPMKPPKKYGGGKKHSRGGYGKPHGGKPNYGGEKHGHYGGGDEY